MQTKNHGTLRAIAAIIVVLILFLSPIYIYVALWPQHKAKTAAAQLLVDPDSAKFRNLFAGTDDTICGEINGKNRYGAYAGFERFTYDISSDTAKLQSELFAELASFYSWEKLCGQN